MDGQTDQQTDWRTDRLVDRQTSKESYRKASRKPRVHITYRYLNRKTGGWIDKLKDTQRAMNILRTDS